MNWLFTSLQWYLVLFFLGIITLPLTMRIFSSFPDKGYSFSKIISILCISYVAFVLGVFKIFLFTQSSLYLIITMLFLINIYLLHKYKNKSKLILSSKKFIFLLVFEELLFLFAFIFWTYIRGQEPSIRSLEKFMDFGFIQSILRSAYFPPLDMWLSANQINPSGFSINYYYFGHLTGAILIRLTNVIPSIGYNLILSSLFALGITQTFSFIIGILFNYLHQIKHAAISNIRFLKLISIGLFGSLITHLGGNLHTIYLFTKGYPNDNPIPFWQILSGYNPIKYWYPNATRFIPFTIHEFPSYSYVVADLHGHVFDIPYVILTLAILFILFVHISKERNIYKSGVLSLLKSPYAIMSFVFLGFLCAVHYMTNAFDGPIYLLLTIGIFFILFSFSLKWFFSSIILLSSFVIFSFPFTHYFVPFVSGIGVNCSPEFLVQFKKIGPFLFEKGNCQISPIWMLFILWGFFWISFLLLLLTLLLRHISSQKKPEKIITSIDMYMLILFTFGTFLIIIPEFFYIKDIYPAHFRANTMFKLGYQAFIMMSIASIYTFFRIKLLKKKVAIFLSFIHLFFFSFIIIYPLFSIPSYYGNNLNRKVELDGSKWLINDYPEDKEIIDYLNSYVKYQPVILEAQGDSYTDYQRISSLTGLPTVAGWWVHEWLWRGSSNIVAERIPDIITLYESKDIYKTMQLIKKYHIKYVVISRLERQKYSQLNEEKFKKIGTLLFRSTNYFGALYQVN